MRFLVESSEAGLQEVKDFEPRSPKGHEWQKDAFTYNQLIGEIGYLHSLTSELVANGEIVLVEKDPTTGEQVLSTDPRAARVMAAFTGPIGGTHELVRRAALHYQIAGESILFGKRLQDRAERPQGYSWEFLSPLEVKFEKKRNPQTREEETVAVRNASGEKDGGEVFTGEQARTSRFYRQDPQFSALADSPMRRVLPLCRELVILSEVVDAIAKSRLSAGILYVPDELSFGPDDETLDPSGADGPTVDAVDRFIEALVNHLKAPVEDHTSAAGLVPLVVNGPAEFADSLKMIPLGRELDKAYQELRSELLARIVRGLDAPPEVLEGMSKLSGLGGGNVATAVDNDFLTKHVVPVGRALVEFLSVAYLRPFLVKPDNEGGEGMPAEEAARFSLQFDVSALIAIAEQGKLISDAHKRLVASDEAYARAIGLAEEDLVSPEEREARMMELLMLGDPRSFVPVFWPIMFPDSVVDVSGMVVPEKGGPSVLDGPNPYLRPGQIPMVDEDALVDAAREALRKALASASR